MFDFMRRNPPPPATLPCPAELRGRMKAQIEAAERLTRAGPFARNVLLL
jgi:hypothetical protein